MNKKLATAALLELEKWIESCHINDEELVCKYMSQLLPSWRIVGIDYGPYNKRGIQSNYIAMVPRKNPKYTDQIGLVFVHSDER